MLNPAKEAMPLPDLRALQLRRLQRQVARVWRRSGSYRRKLEAAGVTPGQIKSLDDVRRLPFTTKEDVVEAQRRHPPLGDLAVVPPGRWQEVHPSSGEQSVYFVWSQADLLHIRDLAGRLLFGCGVRPGDTVHNSFSYGLWVGGLAVHYGAQAVGCCVVPIGHDSLKRHIELIVNFKPRVLVATPSGALYLVDQMRERGLTQMDLGIQVGIFGGEPGVEAPSIRARLERTLNANAYDLYGLAEMAPMMAAECSAKSGLHWAEDHHLVEVVDPRTLAPCAPGEVGILVFTDLTRDAFPLLRYWSNDYAILTDEPCACGRTHARSPGGVRGRSDQLVIFGGTKFYPAEVERILFEFPELNGEYRLVLERDDASLVERCTLVVEAGPQAAGWSTTGLSDRLRRQLREDIRLAAEVRVARYGTLERTLRQGHRIQDLRATRRLSDNSMQT